MKRPILLCEMDGVFAATFHRQPHLGRAVPGKVIGSGRAVERYKRWNDDACVPGCPIVKRGAL